MFKIEAIFNARASVTPDMAATLAQCASQFAANVYLEHENVKLCVDSLIGILSLDLRRGMRVTVIADGGDAERAANSIKQLLEEKIA